jgi:hypothetical protein
VDVDAEWAHDAAVVAGDGGEEVLVQPKHQVVQQLAILGELDIDAARLADAIERDEYLVRDRIGRLRRRHSPYCLAAHKARHVDARERVDHPRRYAASAPPMSRAAA